IRETCSYFYCSTVTATDSYLVGISGFGEGWHNYHHAFPWDYKTAEFGNYRTNLTCAFIDFFVWLGWAYDLKTVNHDIIKRRAARTGDGSLYERTSDEHTQEKFTWGWNDADMSLEDKQAAEILNKSD
ncbi:PREDICTED: acyl-CoA Delta(11) desaturase-like, partial [Vollenhovia emeryi]|uniref:acyl-CoA Delta(11) desaturase-like n=1 Tax=Vollenhovia emeryi TaxID=411798 RepID=UPI0005F41B6F